MRCGVLCDKEGNVKRTWALISDTITVPVEHGDQVTEWECDHGEMIEDPEEKAVCIQAAVKEQDRIVTLKTQDDVRAHREKHQHDMATQEVSITVPSNEPVFYGAGKGLHHRTVDAEGDIQESAVHSSNKLHAVVKTKKERG